MCTSDSQLAAGPRELLWIAPGGRASDRFRPPGALAAPAAMVPAAAALASVARGEWNVPLFEQVYVAQLMTSSEIDGWSRSRNDADDLALVCHPHPAGDYCHGRTLGRFLAAAYGLEVQFDLPDTPPVAHVELRRLTELAAALGTPYARLAKAVQRGKLWSMRASGHVYTTEAAVRRYLADQSAEARQCG